MRYPSADILLDMKAVLEIIARYPSEEFVHYVGRFKYYFWLHFGVKRKLLDFQKKMGEYLVYIN